MRNPVLDHHAIYVAVIAVAHSIVEVNALYIVRFSSYITKKSVHGLIIVLV
jgi:hypothetical protein